MCRNADDLSFAQPDCVVLGFLPSVCFGVAIAGIIRVSFRRTVGSDDLALQFVAPASVARNVALGAELPPGRIGQCRRRRLDITAATMTWGSDPDTLEIRVHFAIDDIWQVGVLYGHCAFFPLPPHQKCDPQLPVLEKCSSTP